MEKIHLRKETDSGLEIGLTFETGTKLHHGDVLNGETSLIVINQTPEKTIRVRFKSDKFSSNFCTVGPVVNQFDLRIFFTELISLLSISCLP